MRANGARNSETNDDRGTNKRLDQEILTNITIPAWGCVGGELLQLGRLSRHNDGESSQRTINTRTYARTYLLTHDTYRALSYGFATRTLSQIKNTSLSFVHLIELQSRRNIDAKTHISVSRSRSDRAARLSIAQEKTKSRNFHMCLVQREFWEKTSKAIVLQRATEYRYSSRAEEYQRILSFWCATSKQNWELSTCPPTSFRRNEIEQNDYYIRSRNIKEHSPSMHIITRRRLMGSRNTALCVAVFYVQTLRVMNNLNARKKNVYIYIFWFINFS